jgi:hypothetical protein
MRMWGLTLLVVTTTVFAHVGSPNLYLESDAGPYHLLVTVNPPAMIPGVAEVQVRVTSGSVSSITVTPVYVNGRDRGLPPAADAMQPSAEDPHWFTGKVWLMESGAWELRTEAIGPSGIGRLAVPVPAYARRTLPMQRGLEILLLALMGLLGAGVVAMAGAAAREGVLVPKVAPTARNERDGRIAMGGAAICVVTLLALGNWWWNVQAADLKHSMLYSAPPLEVSLETDKLTLQMDEDFWHQTRKDQWSMSLVPDHGHLMHLFLLRVPAMDRFYHLHPEPLSEGSFTAKLPTIAAGKYKIFADIVRSTGFPETMVAEIDLPGVAGSSVSGDDSWVSTSAFEPGARATSASTLSDGGRMIWEREGAAPKAGQVSWFRFRVEDAQGRSVDDLEPYMGMAGHAEFVKSDMSVFAHIHPAGSVPTASLMIAERNSGLSMDPGSMDHGSMDHEAMNHGSSQRIASEVSFPYGFPEPGNYRLFVQIKRGGQVQTGVFDAAVN